jgi:hypothetical protein
MNKNTATYRTETANGGSLFRSFDPKLSSISLHRGKVKSQLAQSCPGYSCSGNLNKIPSRNLHKLQPPFFKDKLRNFLLSLYFVYKIEKSLA